MFMEKLTRAEQEALDIMVELEMRELGIEPADSEDENE
jgi:hypothetical protein